MAPLEQLVINQGFVKTAGVMQYVKGNPNYVRSVFTPNALKESWNIFKSWPSQFYQGPKDLYNLGLREGGRSIGRRYMDITFKANPAGAPIALVAPKIVIPGLGLAYAGLRGKNDTTHEV